MTHDLHSRWFLTGVLLLIFALLSFAVMPLFALNNATDKNTSNNENNENKPNADSQTVEINIMQQIANAVVSKRGADGCLRCHDTDKQVNIAEVFQSPHGIAVNPRSPFAQEQCESCHGPGLEHSKRIRRGETRPPMINFNGSHRLDSTADMTELRNQQCLNCHKNELLAWQSSQHHSLELECTQCHSIHVARDPVLEKSTQAQVCFQCHHAQRNDSTKFSHHPVTSDIMSCTDCHSPHSSNNEFSLKKLSVNQTCFQCHADKRGPFLWEHYPVTDNCTTCHDPHGSINTAMLNRRAPLLCQQCHNSREHSSVGFSGSELNANRAEIFMLSNSCTNCHTHVHGSNHPSGDKLNR
ncbi:DmsE family decaheme c-type cytochrome [Pleionea sediminis]|uniref:DmsE family decaheme c-type cytochrome n=1 Tax=Pleionea sediminis TaxID=2569479 RepID=UPI0011863351|nr:DmsE family decaheme c-type cytochrome [Pleionea sediminis]